MSTKQKVEAKPLDTRHVFLDTEVYHKLKHNAANRALEILGRIDIQRSQIMAAARCTKPVKWTVRRS